MNPKQQALNNKQRERQQRGNDFEAEIKRSWRFIPNIWTMKLTDGRGGSRAADRITISQDANFLTELKRTASKSFELSFLRPNQIRGLIDFDSIIDRNYGLVLVSFHDLKKGVDEAYAIRLVAALKVMQRMNKQSLQLEYLRNVTESDKLEPLAVKLPRLDTAEPAYDLGGIIKWYKST